MRKILITASAVLMLSGFIACKKSDDNKNDTRTVQNLSGAYNLTGLVWTALGVSVNVYDSLEPCDKDNIIQLNADLTLDLLDVGVVCDPSETDHGDWSLSPAGDSLYFQGEGAKIKSWDGKTLVLTGIAESGPPEVIGTTTLVKK